MVADRGAAQARRHTSEPPGNERRSGLSPWLQGDKLGAQRRPVRVLGFTRVQPGASALVLVAALALAACRSEAPVADEPAVAARVGDAVLSEADVAAALAALPPGTDSAEARRALVEPFVRRALLAGAARAEGLVADPDVRRRLADAEQAVLELAALDRLLTGTEPSEADVEAFYAAHVADFTLSAMAVRVRHLRVVGPGASARSVQAAVALGRVAASARPDSTFALAAREFSSDPAGAVALASQFVPEARLAEIDPVLAQAVARLQPGAPPVAAPSGRSVHVVQLAERLGAGSVLPLAAVRGQIAERLGVALRTEAAARLVERLRAEATAAGRLRVR